MGLTSRNKGKRGERELAKYLTAAGFPAVRGQQHCGRDGNADVICESLPVYIECKRTNRLNLKAAYEQAVRDAPDNMPPAVFHRADHADWFVTISLDDFLRIFATLKK